MRDNNPETTFVAIVDTETTGLTDVDELISIGIATFEVALPKGDLIRKVDTYYGLRQPSVPISPSAQAVHGISAGELVGRDFDYGRIAEILGPCEFVVAHHADFDARMLWLFVPSIRRKSWRCSVHSIFWHDFVQLANRKLDTICAHFDVSRPSPHNALHDCEALADVLFRRTGKTARSRTFLGAALAKDPRDVESALPTSIRSAALRVDTPVPVSAAGVPLVDRTEIRFRILRETRPAHEMLLNGSQEEGTAMLDRFIRETNERLSKMSHDVAKAYAMVFDEEWKKVLADFRKQLEAETDRKRERALAAYRTNQERAKAEAAANARMKTIVTGIVGFLLILICTVLSLSGHSGHHR